MDVHLDAVPGLHQLDALSGPGQRSPARSWGHERARWLSEFSSSVQ